MKHGDPTLCFEPRCRNLRRKDRRRCHTHDAQRKRAANPMWAAWRNLKDHAKDRGIPFKLKLWQFRKFAVKTDYLNRTGINGNCLTVDRIDNLKGYTFANIQPLTRIKNAEKKMRQDAIRMKSGLAWKE